MLQLQSRYAALAKLADKDNPRYVLGGVRVEDRGEGRFRLAVTDARVLLAVEGESRGVNAANAAAYDALAAALPNGGTEGIISAKEWTAGLKLSGSGKKPMPVALAMTEAPTGGAMEQGSRVGRFTFGTPTAQVGGAMLDGRFPAIDHVFPHGDPVVTVDLNPALVAKIMQSAADIGMDRVTIEVRTKTAANGENIPVPVILRGEADGDKVTGLIMPLSK